MSSKFPVSLLTHERMATKKTERNDLKEEKEKKEVD